MSQINGDTTKAQLVADTHIDLIQWCKNLNWHAKKAITVAEGYTPATPANFNSSITAQDPALDEIAARIKAIEVATPVAGSVQVTLTSAQIKALNATPIQLIAAPAAGSYLEVTKIEYLSVYGTTAYTGSVNLTTQYSTAGANIATVATAGLTDQTANVTKFQGTSAAYATALVAPTATNVTIKASNALTLGDGTMKIRIYYNTIVAQT